MSLVAPTNLRVIAAGVYPTGSSGSYSTGARVRLAWDFDYAGVSGAVTFRVNVDDGALSFTLAGTTTLLELDVTGLPIHLMRTVEVRGENVAAGNSTYLQLGPILTSDPVPASNADVPDSVNLQVALVTTTSVLLSWEYAGFVTTTVTVAATSSDGGAGASAVASGLDKSVTLSGLTAGKTYTFDVVTFGIFAVNVTTLSSYGGHAVEGFCVMVDADDDDPISGPTTVQLDLNSPVKEYWSYIGSGAVISWSLVAGPTGAATLTLPTSDKRLAQLDGAPTQEGVFGATVNVLSQIGLVRSRSRYPVLILVTGPTIGGCLGWYHDDPARVDLQFDERLREVHSFASPTSPSSSLAALQLMRGEIQRVHIIPRDPGGRLIETALLELGVTIRLKDRRDGPVMFTYFHLDSGGDMPVETIGDHDVPYIDLDLSATNPIMDQLFETLNSNPGPEPGAAGLECEMELTLKLTGGRRRSSTPIPVTITQDIDR